MISTLMTQPRDLRLSAMAHALEIQCSQPHTYAELGFEERLGLLVEQELTEREQRKQHRPSHKPRPTQTPGPLPGYRLRTRTGTDKIPDGLATDRRVDRAPP